MKIKQEDWEKAAKILLESVSDDWSQISSGVMITVKEAMVFVPFSQAEKVARERIHQERLFAEANPERGL